MEKAFRSPMFVAGVPLAICGLGIGLNDLLRFSDLSDMASGLLILGGASVLIGWLQISK